MKKYHALWGTCVLSILLALPFDVAPALAQNAKVTKANKNEFSKISGKGKYACRRQEGDILTFGTFKGKKLGPGAIFKEFNRDAFRAKFQAKIDRWNAKVEGLQAKADRKSVV